MREAVLQHTIGGSDKGLARAGERPIFLFGCPRSGTSLLSRILDAHPRIAIPFESHLYNTFYPWLKYYGDLRHSENKERLVNDILATEVVRDWSPRPERRGTLEAIERDDFHGVVEGLMRAWAHSQGKPRWGEKTPPHAFWWRQILAGFPDLQVVHVVRDGRDVALSWINARFGPKHVLPAAAQWVRYIETVDALRAAVSEDAYYEIRYEDLLANPEAMIQAVCRFLHEEYLPEMLSYYRHAPDYRTDRINIQNLKRPILRDNAAKWKTRMSKGDLRIFEAVAGTTLGRLGYEPHFDHPQISDFERQRIRYLEHPLRRAWAMLSNTKGHVDALRRLRIYLRLRVRAAW